MIVPTQPQLLAALTAARKAIQTYSATYSHMVSDEILIPVVSDALTAALNIEKPFDALGAALKIEKTYP